MAKYDLRRKLTTIMVADIVGFSKLTAHDEDWTIRQLNDFRKVVDEIISRHHGRIFNTGGDSILAEFPSPVEAVLSAVDFQDASRSRNILHSRDRQLRFRIGINVGDVIEQDRDLLGDGVNVAARLEGLAEPGGICVSGSVWEQIAGKLSISYTYIGEQSVKNIPRPIPVYQLHSHDRSEELHRYDERPKKLIAPRRTGRFVVAPVVGGAIVLLIIIGCLGWGYWPRAQSPPETPATAPPQPTIHSSPEETARRAALLPGAAPPPGPPPSPVAPTVSTTPPSPPSAPPVSGSFGTVPPRLTTPQPAAPSPQPPPPLSTTRPTTPPVPDDPSSNVPRPSAPAARVPPSTEPDKVGPGFDCSKVSQPLAQLVCADPVLSRVDLRFNQAYRALFYSLSGDERTALHKEDEDVVAAVKEKCGLLDSDTFSQDDLNARDCVKDMYNRQRQLWLERLTGVAYEEAIRPLTEHILLERKLRDLGFLADAPVIPEGVYGPKTRAAISEWQQSRGRHVTGFLGDEDALILEEEEVPNETVEEPSQLRKIEK